MIVPNQFTKTIILFLLVWLPLHSFSKAIPIGNQESKQEVHLNPHLSILEDSLDVFTADELYFNQNNFIPLSQFKITEPDHTFWLHTSIQTAPNLSQRHFSITFDHLTFVDLYLYQDGFWIEHKLAGVFRERKFISPEDNRFTFNIFLEPGANYTLLFKVKHVKKYPPIFDFVLQNTFTSLAANHKIGLLNSLLLGAIAILILYTAILWFINRYRPYLWLLVLMTGVGIYSFAIRPFFIDTLFPEHPETGWLLILPFLHLGVIGFYLLMVDFLEIRKNSPRLYIYSKYLIAGMFVFFLVCFLINSTTGNYRLSNTINLYIAPVHLVYIGYILIFLRKKLNPAQHYLIYGILLFGVTVIFSTINSVLLNEQSLTFFPILAKLIMLCISLLFLAGLHKQLQQHELEKIVVLQELNDLQLQYNTRIEKNVEERTLELKNTNAKLVKQQVQLIEKNRHIEILMDELNHRVKNNLQMLYSLNTLQLPLVQDGKGKQILNEMRGRIKAMMLVNEHLHSYKRNESITVAVFIDEIASHLQQIYDREKIIKISTSIPDDIRFKALEALPFGLLLTELFTNSYKHAFGPSHPQPTIKLRLFTENEQIKFTFEDNGQGADHYFKDDSMGIFLVQDLTRQLKGTVTIHHKDGFSYQFTFSTASQYAHLNH